MTAPKDGESSLAVRSAKPGYHPPADAPHHQRMADVDPRARQRAERQVAIMYSLAMGLAVAAIIAFFLIPGDVHVRVPGIGEPKALHFTFGSLMGLALLLVGLGTIHWAKKLMTDVEVVQERHSMESDAADTAAAKAVFEAGTEQSGFTKFPIIRRTLLGALAIVPIPFIFLLRDLWVRPKGTPGPVELLSTTMWGKGVRIISDITHEPIKAADIPVGGLVNAIPEGLPEKEEEDGNLNERAKAALIVIRMRPEDIVSEQGEGFSYQGILAFSKICTHVGCPISLYEQRTHHLLCPCHQSTFDLSDSGNVVFGPAARRMPQLPIGVDDEGYLIATSDFVEPVGPSFWERERA